MARRTSTPTVLAAAALAVALLALAVGVLALWRAHEARALARQPAVDPRIQQLLPMLQQQRGQAPPPPAETAQ